MWRIRATNLSPLDHKLLCQCNLTHDHCHPHHSPVGVSPAASPLAKSHLSESGASTGLQEGLLKLRSPHKSEPELMSVRAWDLVTLHAGLPSSYSVINIIIVNHCLSNVLSQTNSFLPFPTYEFPIICTG